MKGLGLVLAGGGGKGAYQIGAWKYLRENGIDRYINCVSGTSVGALNAALFAAGDYNVAEAAWRNITPEQILSPKRVNLESVLHWLGTAAAVGNISLNTIINSITNITVGTLAPVMIKALSGACVFSRDGLKDIMEKNVDFRRIQSSPIPCFATCMRVPSFQVERFELREYSMEEAETILLASAAIPIVFDKVCFKGQSYYDGGLPVVGDNVPVEPVYRTGVENILVVHLSRDQLVDRNKFPDARIIEIVPKTDLGGPIDGTLDFTNKGAAWRIEQGYRDAADVFGMFVEVSTQGYINQQYLERFLQTEQQFQREMQNFQLRDEKVRRAMESDGFDRMCHELELY